MSFAFNRRRLGRSGTTALEFGLLAGVFFALLMAGMDLGRYYLTLHSLHTLLGKAMRAALIDPQLTGCSAPVSGLSAATPFLDPAKLTLCVSQSVASGMTTITVTATYPFTFLLPAWTGDSTTLSDQTTGAYASTAN